MLYRDRLALCALMTNGVGNATACGAGDSYHGDSAYADSSQPSEDQTLQELRKAWYAARKGLNPNAPCFKPAAGQEPAAQMSSSMTYAGALKKPPITEAPQSTQESMILSEVIMSRGLGWLFRGSDAPQITHTSALGGSRGGSVRVTHRRLLFDRGDTPPLNQDAPPLSYARVVKESQVHRGAIGSSRLRGSFLAGPKDPVLHPPLSRKTYASVKQMATSQVSSVQVSFKGPLDGAFS